MNKINKVLWREIKHKVLAVNPSLYEAIERVQPNPEIPFFLACYDFGEHFGISNSAYLPTQSGTLEKIGSKHTANELFQHLGYGKDSIPLGMILDKFCEWHHLGDNGRLFPDCVQGAGAIFNMQIVFDEDHTVENNTLSASSGALSSFMLPNIGCQRKHARLQRYFKVTQPAPKSPYEHHQIFREILKNDAMANAWQSEILYFSQEFVEQVQHNDEWLRLKLYFSEALRKKQTMNTYDPSCNELFLSADKINRFRPTPFIIDTAKYLFNIGMGSGIGVKPAVNEDYFPVRAIQKIYRECYGLEYNPTIMVPAALKQEKDSVFYPLQCPFAKINTFKTNQSTSTINELEKLKNVVLAYQAEFTEKGGAAYGSPLYHVSKNTEFTFYHYQPKNMEGLCHPTMLRDTEPGFLYSYENEPAELAMDAKLFRGCVRLVR